MKRFIAVSLALIMSLTALVGCGSDKLTLDSVKADPVGAITEAGNIASAAIEKKSAFVAAMKKLSSADAKSVEVAASADELASVSLTANTSASKNLASGKLSFSISETESDTYFWADKSGVAVKSPGILGEETYGVNFDTFTTDAKSSALLDMMGIDYEDIAASTDSVIKSENLRQALEQLKKDLIATANGDAVVEEEDVALSSGNVSTVSVKLPLNTTNGNAYIDAVAKFADMFASAAIDSDTIGSLKAELADILEGADIFAKVYLSKKTGIAVRSDISVAADDVKITSTSTMLTDNAASIDNDIAVTVESDGETANITGEIRAVAESGKEGVTYKLSVPDMNGSGEADITVSAVRNTSDGKLELKAGGKFGGAETSYTVTGNLTYSDTECSLVLDPIDIPDVCKINASFKVVTGVEPEAIPAYNNVLTLDQDGIQSLMLDIASSEVIWDLESIFGNGGYDYDDDDFDWDDDDFDWDEDDLDWGDDIDWDSIDWNDPEIIG